MLLGCCWAAGLLLLLLTVSGWVRESVCARACVDASECASLNLSISSLSLSFYPPPSISQSHFAFWLDVCLFVCRPVRLYSLYVNRLSLLANGRSAGYVAILASQHNPIRFASLTSFSVTRSRTSPH